MKEIFGKTHWAIAEGYIPGESHGPEPEMTSHETACILNTTGQTAHIEIMIYYTDRDPVGPYRVEVSPKRVKHVRFNELENPKKIPVDTDYACTIISNVPIVVQHTRLDSRQTQNALMSTMGYAEP